MVSYSSLLITPSQVITVIHTMDNAARLPLLLLALTFTWLAFMPSAHSHDICRELQLGIFDNSLQHQSSHHVADHSLDSDSTGTALLYYLIWFPGLWGSFCLVLAGPRGSINCMIVQSMVVFGGIFAIAYHKT